MYYGSEFKAGVLQQWLRTVDVEPIYSYPGSPWENGYNERFNGTLRHEVLNPEVFYSLDEAQAVIAQWIHQYNHIRPHQSLDHRPPVPETIASTLSQHLVHTRGLDNLAFPQSLCGTFGLKCRGRSRAFLMKSISSVSN